MVVEATAEERAKTRTSTLPFASGLLFFAACLLFVFFALRFFSYAEDDVFIPMRYALNFWRGAGWVMNPGERVEGCTSPLQLALVTLLIRFLSPDGVLWVCKILGLVVGAGVLWQARQLARLTWPHRLWIGDLVPLLIALRPDFALSMTNGLETGLATLLLTAGVVRFLRAAREDHARDWQSAALLLLGAALARPELGLTFPLMLGVSALGGLRSRHSLSALALYGLPLALFECLRLAYYGSPLPNTYWAKHLLISQALPLGLSYLGRYALPVSVPFGLTLTGLGLWALLRQKRPDRLVLPAVLGLHALFLLRSGGDWMMDGRFFAVVLPLSAVVWGGSLQAACDLSDRLGDSRHSLRLAGLIALGAYAALALAHDAARRTANAAAQPGVLNIGRVIAPHAPLEEWKPGNHDGRLAIARWVAGHAQPGQLVLASEMGLMTIQNPDVRFLDIRGLADARIARMENYPRDLGGVQGEREWMDDTKPLGQYVRRRRPHWVILLWDVYHPDRAGVDAANDLYVPAGTFPIRCDGRTLTVATWRRRDVPPPSSP